MTAPHWHDVLEIDFVRRGQGLYLIDDRSYPIAQDFVFVIPPGVPHRTSPVAANPHWNLKLYFRPDALAPLGGRAVEHALAVAREVRHVQTPEFRHLWEDLFGDLLVEDNCTDQFSSLAACTKLLEACILVSRCMVAAHRPAADPPSPTARYVRGMMEYVEARLGQPLALGDIAAAVGLHPNYACTLFRQKTGTTLFAYIAAQRAERARALLLTTKLPVTEVARRCGYRSVPTFYRTFRAAYGRTPTKLRLQQGVVAQ